MDGWIDRWTIFHSYAICINLLHFAKLEPISKRGRKRFPGIQRCYWENHRQLIGVIEQFAMENDPCTRWFNQRSQKLRAKAACNKDIPDFSGCPKMFVRWIKYIEVPQNVWSNHITMNFHKMTISSDHIPGSLFVLQHPLPGAVTRAPGPSRRRWPTEGRRSTSAVWYRYLWQDGPMDVMLQSWENLNDLIVPFRSLLSLVIYV